MAPDFIPVTLTEDIDGSDRVTTINAFSVVAVQTIDSSNCNVILQGGGTMIIESSRATVVAAIEAALTLNPWFSVETISPQAIVSTTSFADATDLSFTADAAAIYELEIGLVVQTSGFGGFKATLNVPAGGTWSAHGSDLNSSATGISHFSTGDALITRVTSPSGGYPVWALVRAVVQIASGGTVKIQVAQLSASGTTFLNSRSFMKYRKR